MCRSWDMKISYSQVEGYCNELHQLAKHMKDLIYDIESTSNKVSSSDTWSGQAANYYTQKMKKLCSNFDEMFTELENSVLYMAKCSDGYQAMDKTVVAEICNNLNIQSPSLNSSKIFS